MKNWEKLFADAKNSGVYPVEEEKLEYITQAANQEGLEIFFLDLASVNDKTGFFNETARILQFPEYFGSNWDAFEECLTDLAWLEAQGYVLLIKNSGQFQQSAPIDAAMARKILNDAAAYWKRQEMRFFVLYCEKR